MNIESCFAKITSLIKYQDYPLCILNLYLSKVSETALHNLAFFLPTKTDKVFLQMRFSIFPNRAIFRINMV